MTRATLVSAAEALFNETGTTATSVELIAKKAGYTRGAFYSNFRSIDELYFAVYAQQADDVLQSLEDSVSHGFSAAGSSVDDVVRSFILGIPPEHKWWAIRSVLLNLARHDQEMRELLRAHTDHFHATLEPILAAAVARAGRRPTVDLALFTRAVVAAHNGAVLQTVLLDDPITLRVVAVKGCVMGLTEPAEA